MLDNALNTNGLSESGNSPAGGSPGANRAGGKVTHDSRGNAVWEWGVATGVFARIKANELLSMLDNPMLALEGDCQLTADEWAGDPYNRR